MKMCICTKCGIRFDRDKIPAIPDPARKKRYMHDFDCSELVATVTEEEKQEIENKKERLALTDYIQSKLPNPNWNVIGKQIKQYEAEGYTSVQIQRTLRYFYEISHGHNRKDVEGIGIFPYVVEDAREYYNAADELVKSNLEKDIGSKEIEITIPIPRKKNTILKLIDIEEIVDEE